MPIPKPQKREKQDEFIQRGMSNPTMKKEFPDIKQRLAVLYSQWRKYKGGTKPEPEKHAHSNTLKFGIDNNDLIKRYFPELEDRASYKLVIANGVPVAYIPQFANSPLLYVLLTRPMVASQLKYSQQLVSRI
ncbi:MAG: hypothetical protein QXY15_11235 [Candidatus Nitrosotenuis sp.]